MNILNEFIGICSKNRFLTVIGIGLVLSPSIAFMNVIYTLLFPNLSAVDPSGVSFANAFFWISLLLAVIVAPLLEEFTYRGLMLVFIKLTNKPLIMILISSAVFGFMHEGTFNAFQATIAGAVLGYVAYKYGLAYSITMHIIVNSISLFNGYILNIIMASPIFLVLIFEIGLGIYVFRKNNDYLFSDFDFTEIEGKIRKVYELWQKNRKSDQK